MRLILGAVLATVMACPLPGEPKSGCDNNPSSCWVVNVQYRVNDAVGGPPAYSTHDLYPRGASFIDRGDAEGAAAKIAVTGVWEREDDPDPVSGRFIPPSAIDGVTIVDVLAVR